MFREHKCVQGYSLCEHNISNYIIEQSYKKKFIFYLELEYFLQSVRHACAI